MAVTFHSFETTDCHSPYQQASHVLYSQAVLPVFNSMKHVMWTAAPSYEELSILVTQTEARANSRPGNVLCNDPSVN
jgi:hypothetical protein